MVDAIVPAEGIRSAWHELPEPVRSAVQVAIGWTVISAYTQPGGFSPGVAARLRGADDQRVFVKAVSATQNPDAPDIHRREARIAAALPSSPLVPRLIDVYDDGDWVALVFTEVAGHLPQLPWRSDELETVIAGIDRLHTTLTPNPVTNAPNITADLNSAMHCWQSLADDESVHDHADAWSLRHMEALIGLTEGWESGVRGDTLLHGDLRADNILLTTDGPVVVDWPWAARGAAWVDSALMAPSVAAQQGPPPAEFLARFPKSAEVPHDALVPFVVGLAGYYTYLA